MNTVIITFFVIFAITPEHKIVQGPYSCNLETFKSSIDMIKEMPYQTGIFQKEEEYLIIDNTDQNDIPVR